MANKRILIVDDQPAVAQTCAAIMLEDKDGTSLEPRTQPTRLASAEE